MKVQWGMEPPSGFSRVLRPSPRMTTIKSSLHRLRTTEYSGYSTIRIEANASTGPLDQHSESSLHDTSGLESAGRLRRVPQSSSQLCSSEHAEPSSTVAMAVIISLLFEI